MIEPRPRPQIRSWKAKPRKKWPLSGASTIALLALAVSAVQLLVTAPLLTQFYLRPKLVLSGSSSTPDAKFLMAMFTLKNVGTAAATKVEIGLMVESRQQVSVGPYVGARIIDESEDPLGLFQRVPEVKKMGVPKNVRVEVERVLPGEQIMINVFPGGLGSSKLDEKLAEGLKGAGITEFPAVTFVRSAEARVELTRLKEKKP